VIAGTFGGRKGPASTFTPIELWNVELKAGRHAELPLRDGHTAAFLVLRGDVTVGGRTAREGDLVIFSRNGEGIALDATSDAKLFVMSGEPIPEPIVGYGPFVMNTRTEIEQAFEDYSQGRMGELTAT
jgi:quercetin 2,3-dioxygenase